MNPHGYPVDVSPTGQCKPGEWPLVLCSDNVWRKRDGQGDDGRFFTARLIVPEPKELADVPEGFLALPMIYEEIPVFHPPAKYSVEAVQGQVYLIEGNKAVYVFVGYMRGHAWNESLMSYNLLFPRNNYVDTLPDYAIFRRIPR
jgi:hypothetical protein